MDPSRAHAQGENMRTTGLVAVFVGATVVGLSACTSSPKPDSAPSIATGPAPSMKGFMPDVVGGSVAGAVGQLEGTLRVDDVSGQGRVVPTDGAATGWKICTQQPGPGAALDGGQRIVLGAVKTDESC